MNKFILSGIAVGVAAALHATSALADISACIAGPLTAHPSAYAEQ